MADLESGALALLDRALAMAGVRVQKTTLEDSAVQLVMDVGQIASSSRPFTPDLGFVVIAAQNIHAGAGAETSNVPVYVPGTTLNTSGLVSAGREIDDYDIWLHSAHTRSGSPSSITGCAWMLNYGSTTMAITDGITTLRDHGIASWDNFYVEGAISGADSRPLGFRMPRTPDGLQFTSQATGAVTIDAFILAEFVPRGLKPSGF